MKLKMTLTAAACAVLLPAGANAFVISLQGDILADGLTTTGGDALSDAAGLLRYGYFGSFDAAQIQANANNLGALEADFTEVASTSMFFDGFPGFSSQNYELVADGADRTSYINNIAGNTVTLWAFNANDSGSATEHGIFQTSIVFASGVDDTNALTSFSIDTGTPGLAAIVGSLSAGPDIGGGVASHQLALIPEPGVTVLTALSGLLLIMRRRR